MLQAKPSPPTPGCPESQCGHDQSRGDHALKSQMDDRDGRPILTWHCVESRHPRVRIEIEQQAQPIGNFNGVSYGLSLFIGHAADSERSAVFRMKETFERRELCRLMAG